MSFFILDDRWQRWEGHTGAWICDCGPFLGEWPPYAPLEMPDDAGEVQLLVCLPPPDGNLAHLVDGSYPTAYSWPRIIRHGPVVNEDGSYEIAYSGGEGSEEPADPYIPPTPGTVPGGDAPLMGASASSNATFNTLNSAAGPFGCRRTFSSGLPANFLASPAGPDYAASRDSYWSFKPNPHTFATDSAAQAAFTAYLATVPAGHRLTIITWHEPEDNISKGEFTLAEWKSTVNKVAQLIQATGRPELRAAVCFMSYWTFDTSGYGGMDFLTGINWANIDSIGLDPYRYNPGDKSMEQMLTVGNSGRTSSVQSCMAKLSALGKSFFIAEWGCTQTNVTVAEKARWISEAYAWFKSWNATHGATHIEATMYFNNNLDVGVNPKATWELSGAALTAFAAAVDDAPAAPPDSTPPTDSTPGDGYNGGVFLPIDSAPAGAHLYLIWYDLDASDTPAYPSKPPLSIVPQGMVAGSTGPARGSRINGHWSGWQPRTDSERDPVDHRHSGRPYGANVELGGVSDLATIPPPFEQLIDAKSDPLYGLDALLDETRSGAIAHYTRPTEHDVIISSGKTGQYGSAGFGYTSAQYLAGVSLTQTVATFVGTGLEGQKDYPFSFFYDLIFGVDYVGIPGSNEAIEWESQSAELVGWADWNVDIGRVSAGSFMYNTGHGFQYHYFGNTVIPLTGFANPTYRYQAFDAELVGDPYDVAGIELQPYGAGVNVGEFTPAMDASSAAEQPIGGNTTLTLSEVGAVPILSVMVQCDYQGPLGQPITNYTVHDYPGYDENEGTTLQAGSQVFIRISFWGIEQGARYVDNVWTQLFPKVIYRNPRWRYWIPGPIPDYIPLGDLGIGATTRNSIIFW